MHKKSMPSRPHLWSYMICKHYLYNPPLVGTSTVMCKCLADVQQKQCRRLLLCPSHYSIRSCNRNCICFCFHVVTFSSWIEVMGTCISGALYRTPLYIQISFPYYFTLYSCEGIYSSSLCLSFMHSSGHKVVNC